MFSGSNNPPPPPPTYNEVTRFSGLSNQYNTEYSQPLGQSSVQPAQPAQPQSFGQPQTYGQPPTYGNPQSFGQPHSVPKPMTYSQPHAPSQPQSFGQHSSQLPTSVSTPPYPTQGGRNQPAVTSVTPRQQQQHGSSQTRQQEIQRKAIIAIVCCVPFGVWGWFEYKQAEEAYSSGNDQVGKAHERRAHNLMNTAICLGCVIVALIIFNPFQYLPKSEHTSHTGDGLDWVPD